MLYPTGWRLLVIARINVTKTFKKPRRATVQNKTTTPTQKLRQDSSTHEQIIEALAKIELHISKNSYYTLDENIKSHIPSDTLLI